MANMFFVESYIVKTNIAEFRRSSKLSLKFSNNTNTVSLYAVYIPRGNDKVFVEWKIIDTSLRKMFVSA